MNNIVVGFCTSIIDQHCCDAFLNKWDFKNFECVSLVFSRMIGIGVIFFSSIIKIPQIYQIVHFKSGFGLSMTAMYLEITVNVLSIVYHYQRYYPFSTYGEAYFVLAQNVIIAFLVSHYNHKYPILLWDLLMVMEMTLIFAVVKKTASLSLISFLWKLNMPLSLFYKITQIYETWKKKCKGELSTVSSFLKSFGSLGRVFTTVREIHDISIFFLYFINFSLNAIIWVQCLIYPKKLESLFE